MIKYIVWGNGLRGKNFLRYMGKERIEAFIDQNPSMQGGVYEGIPIISREEYLRKYYNYPVVITPLNNELKIEQWLLEQGIYWSFHYEENWAKTEAYMMQVPREKLLEGYQKEDVIGIYGWNILALLIYDEMKDRGLQCELILQEGISNEIRKYVKDQLGIKEGSLQKGKYQKIILSMEPSGQDEILLDAVREVEAYYNLTKRKELFYFPKLERFHNIHKGERCFIVATGPSLKIKDLDLLHEKQEICISMNKIYKGYGQTPWRPDYYIAIDYETIYGDSISVFERSKVAQFIGDIGWHFDGDNQDTLYKWHEYHSWDGENLPMFSDDFARGLYWGMTITYHALQLAVYMGFSEIYLVGVDCCRYEKIEEQHFVKDYNSMFSNIRVNESIMSYTAANEYAKQHGIKIYNATRGGQLEVFERVDFDSLF